MIDSRERLRGLVEAGIELTSELTLDGVLRRLVETAAQLTEAQYAALGVIDPSGRGLERFVTTGVDEETLRAIGEHPRGRGILGVLIREARPLRLHDLTEDPRSVGFPPGHPPMHTFLGVPIVLRGVAYGNLYLCEKAGGEDFTEADEEVVTLLAAQAAVAIENARLYESATRWLRHLESMIEVGNALAGEFELPRLLELICQRLRELVSARTVFVALPAPDGSLRIEAAADEHDIRRVVGLRIDRARSKSGRVFDRRRTDRVDSIFDDPEVDRAVLHDFSEQTDLPVPATGIYVPLVLRDRAIGVVVIHDKLAGGRPSDLRFSDEDVRIAEALAARAATAVDLSERVQRDVLRRVVAAQEAERQRIALELHDETGQALTSLLLGLRTASDTTDPATRERVLGSLRELASSTLQDVRRLAVELRPKALDDFGLVPALERLGDGLRERTGLQVDIVARLVERLPPEVETALYRIVQEALTNVVKHAGARHVSVLLTRKAGSVSAVVEDDGVGFDPSEDGDGGLGLVGMRERVALLGGRLSVESGPESGTTIAAEVPIR
jgi:signal transduction histidine kinase